MVACNDDNTISGKLILKRMFSIIYEAISNRAIFAFE